MATPTPLRLGVNLAADTTAINTYYSTTAPIAGVTVTDTLGAIVITGAASTSTLLLQVQRPSRRPLRYSGVVSDTLAATPAAATGNSLPLTLNSSTLTAAVSTVVSEANNQTIAITSNAWKGGTTANVVNILDTTTTVAGSNNATSMTIAGAGAVTVKYAVSAAAGTAADVLATINASSSTGAIDVTGVTGKSTGLTITSGTGVLTATGTTGATATDTFNISSGALAAVVTLGTGGAGGAAGRENINISNTAANAWTIQTDATSGLQNATFTGWNTANTLNFAVAKTVVANAAAGQSTSGASGVDTYAISNGVVTFTGADYRCTANH